MVLWEDTDTLHATVERARSSPYSAFYAETYSHLADPWHGHIEELPFLTRGELVETPPDDRCYVPREDVAFVGYTSGTTSGTPLILYFGSVPHYFFEPSLGTDITRLLITYPPLNKNFGYSFVQQCRQATRPVTPVFGDFERLANSAVLAAHTQCDALVATPTIAQKLHPYLEEHYDPRALRLLLLSSETLSPAGREVLTSLYPNALIANLYASAEIGQFLLYPCPHMLTHQIPHFHFLSEALTALELVNGELVVTYTRNPALPLIRYRTGDYFEVASDACPCGLPGPTLAWSGRDDVDRIRVQGFEIRAAALDAFFAGHAPEHAGAYELHISSTTNAPTSAHLTLYLHKAAHATYDPELAAGIVRERFLNAFMLAPKVRVADALARGDIQGVTVTCTDPPDTAARKRRPLVNHLS